MCLCVHQDTGRELERLCSFLGLSTTAEERECIRGGVQFDAMKANPMANYSTDPVMDQKISPFMRKGRNSQNFLWVGMDIWDTGMRQSSWFVPVCVDKGSCFEEV